MAPSFDRVVTLLCTEDVIGGEWDEDETGNTDSIKEGSNIDVDEDDGDYEPFVPELPVEDLIEKEASFAPQKNYAESFRGQTVELQSRENTINWMLDVAAYYQFSRLTAFLSVTYFDRFLSTHQTARGKAWMLQLLAVGCVSLAAKMEEAEVPLLLDLQVGEVQHFFEARTIQRMELLILSTLCWRMSSVTPFSYVSYLLHRIGRGCRLWVLRSEELILNTCRAFSFLMYRPSVIAVASIICACKELRPLQAESYTKALLSIWPCREGMTLECAGLMREMQLTDPLWAVSAPSLSLSSSSSSPSSSSSALHRTGAGNADCGLWLCSPIGVLDAARSGCFSCEPSEEAACTSTTSTPSARIHLAAANLSRKRKFHESYSVVLKP